MGELELSEAVLPSSTPQWIPPLTVPCLGGLHHKCTKSGSVDTHKPVQQACSPAPGVHPYLSPQGPREVGRDLSPPGQPLLTSQETRRKTTNLSRGEEEKGLGLVLAKTGVLHATQHSMGQAGRGTATVQTRLSNTAAMC